MEVIKLMVSEVFVSYQGEGRYVGYPMVFVRLAGCNLKCRWCDTKYAWDIEKAKKLDPMQVSQLVLERNVEYVCLTGGEPMVQRDEVMELLRYLKWGNRKVHLETNGTIDFDERRFDYVVVSPKSVDVLEKWWFRDVDLKLVVGRDDWDMWKEALLNCFEMGRRIGRIYVMPRGRTNKELMENFKGFYEDLLESFGEMVLVSPRMQVQYGVP